MYRKLLAIALLISGCTKHVDTPVLNSVPKASVLVNKFVLLDPSASTGGIVGWTWAFDSSVTPAVPYVIPDSIQWWTPRSFTQARVNAPTELFVPVSGKYWFRLTVYDSLGGYSSNVIGITVMP